MRDDVNDLMDSQKSSQRQTLYLLHSQVKRDRSEASCQLVVQGFELWAESSNPITSFRARDQWCLAMCSKLSGVPAELIKMTCSHGTAADRLSRLSIITLQSAALTSSIARAAGAKKHHYMGSTSVSIRRQTCVYDRLVSAPIKIVMECVSRTHPHLRNRFRPSWRDGHLWADDGELLGIWRIDIQRARIRLHLQARFLDSAREGMDAGLERLQLGSYVEAGDGQSQPMDGKGKSKGRGKGKAKAPARYLQPTERGSFKHAPPACRSALGSLVLSEYPISVSVREMKDEHLVEAGVSNQSLMQKKRLNDGEAASASQAKRTPTPERGAPRDHDRARPYAELSGQATDSWALAQQKRESKPVFTFYAADAGTAFVSKP